MNRNLAAGLTALALLLGLTGCAPSRESAEQAADNALTAVQKWDEKTAGAYFGSEILQGGEEAPETAALAERLAAQYACVEYRPCAGCRE